MLQLQIFWHCFWQISPISNPHFEPARAVFVQPGWEGGGAPWPQLLSAKCSDLVRKTQGRRWWGFPWICVVGRPYRQLITHSFGGWGAKYSSSWSLHCEPYCKNGPGAKKLATWFLMIKSWKPKHVFFRKWSKKKESNPVQLIWFTLCHSVSLYCAWGMPGRETVTRSFSQKQNKNIL